MADGFLQRYAEELNGLRGRAERFAAAHPKVASRLRISGETADDPHVERIVQSFAYVAARIRQKLDDEFPELTGSLLETLYPHYLAPVPSMGIVRMSPVEGLDSVQAVPRGSEIAAEPIRGERCRFRTTQDVEIAPVALARASLGGLPIEAPLAVHLKAAACLRLSIAPVGERTQISAMGLKRLRFHLQAPWRDAVALHELVLNHTIGIAVARHADDLEPLFLPRSKLRAIGFDAAEGMLPYPPSSFAGYRLLTEFFALPQKFLFFEIDGLDGWNADELEIFLYLDQSNGALERSVTADDFALHAAPIVNLFRQRAEPITIDGARTEYHLTPDARRHDSREVYAVEQVALTDGLGEKTVSPHFFEGGGWGDAICWQLRRGFDPVDGTTDVGIAFVDRSGRAAIRPDMVASVDTLCLNRDLAEKLPYGGGHPYLELADRSSAVRTVEAVAALTPVVRLDDDDERRWRLVSHLNLNHLSLLDSTGAALKDILRLYALRDLRETNQLIDAIVGLESRQSVARMAGGGMAPGTDVTIVFDPAQIDRASAYLFGSVLDRFFALYTSINSFTRLTVALRGQSEPIASWPPRAADRPLL